MPIRAENKARYPADWPQISASIRERAGNKCEECGVANRALGGRADDGTFLPADPTGDNGIAVYMAHARRALVVQHAWRPPRVAAHHPHRAHRRAPQPQTRGLPAGEPALLVPAVPQPL
uniref:hypothetical protein n=1 Tax=Afipia felis TaxID=1035 RepID=UPI000E1FE35C|nr:hypothetical protein [Afipia felis]